MPCPYFIPTHRRDDLLWPHPARLPLGAGFGGQCGAPGHCGAIPSDTELQDHCNLGYARCSRLPADRAADAVRFAVTREAAESLTIMWVLERDHAPAGHGAAECSRDGEKFFVAPADRRIQKQLQCFAAQYRARTPRAAPPRERS
jgi:hypothetical protein